MTANWDNLDRELTPETQEHSIHANKTLDTLPSTHAHLPTTHVIYARRMLACQIAIPPFDSLFEHMDNNGNVGPAPKTVVSHVVYGLGHGRKLAEKIQTFTATSILNGLLQNLVGRWNLIRAFQNWT